MILETMTIKRGRGFQKFFPSTNLERATVFASFGTLKSDGHFLKRGQFEVTVKTDGYILSMNETDTSSLRKEVVEFDILVERPDSSWPEEKNAIFEYGGILKVE